MQARVYFDLSNLTATLTNTTEMESLIPLPAEGIQPRHLEFQLFLDHSQLEVYAFGGLAVGTIKVYPNNMSQGNWSLSLLSMAEPGNVSASATLYHLHSCWVKNVTAEVPVARVTSGGYTEPSENDLLVLP